MALKETCQAQAFLNTGEWPRAMDYIYEVLEICSQYTKYLEKNLKQKKLEKTSTSSASSSTAEMNIEVLEVKKTKKQHSALDKVAQALDVAPYFEPISVKQHLPTSDS